MENSYHNRNNIELESVRFIKAFQSNDKRAFDRLLFLHKKLVFNLCFRFLGNYDEADDCAQEVFIKMYRFLKKFRFESKFTTWIYRITVNTCKNRLRSLEYRLKNRKMRINHRQSEANGKTIAAIRDDSFSPASVLNRKEITRLIQEAVRKLPTQQKLIVVLRDMEGRSYEEIGEITGFKLGTVKSKLSRARQQLRVMLKGRI